MKLINHHSLNVNKENIVTFFKICKKLCKLVLRPGSRHRYETVTKSSECIPDIFFFYKSKATSHHHLLKKCQSVWLTTCFRYPIIINKSNKTFGNSFFTMTEISFPLSSFPCRTIFNPLRSSSTNTFDSDPTPIS